jgi:hypothetical protein
MSSCYKPSNTSKENESKSDIGSQISESKIPSEINDNASTSIANGSENNSSINSTDSISSSIISSQTSTTTIKKDYAGGNYTYTDLGAMQMKSFPSDYLYDWGFSVIKEGNIYKMWWVRPSQYDAIWYAESIDFKNWYNEKRVLTISSPIVKEYEWLKWMIAKPSVIKVNGTYHMYFEGPATNEIENGVNIETDNNVFLATSKNGLDWTLYPNNTNPEPVIRQPKNLMGKRYYGVGQPSAFYKDGVYYVYYCYVMEGKNQVMVATSNDGKNFGNPLNHKNLGMINGSGVKYNAVTNKYVMIFDYRNKPADYGNYYIMESSDPLNWPYQSTSKAAMSSVKVTNNKGHQYAFPEFVTNEQGHITTETFYITYMQGKISKTSDWRAEYRTWDGHISAVNPKEFAKKEIVLPNGKIQTSSSILQYNDMPTTLGRQSTNAKFTNTIPKIDGNKDSGYDTSTELIIKRSIYDWGSNLTSTNGKARILWDKDNLYAYIEIKDKKISYGYKGGLGDMWRRDSVDIIIDVPNYSPTTPTVWGPKQYLMSVCANGEFIVKGSHDVDITDDFAGISKAVKFIPGGYVVEVLMPWHYLVKAQILQNKTIGFDIQINDDMGLNNREAMLAWNDHTGNAFRYTDVLGKMKLNK